MESINIPINGLINFNNSCYFNASLQFIKPIIDKLYCTYPNDTYIQSLLFNYYKIYTNSSELRNKYIDISTKIKSNFAQEDSCQSLELLLDEINNSFKKNINVEFKQLIRCTQCNEYKILNEERTDTTPILISHELNNVNNNENILFDKFLGSILTKEQANPSLNAYKEFKKSTNCNCSEKNIIMQTVLTNMPQFLIINTNRTKFVSINRSIKSKSLLQISNEFNITTPDNLNNRCNGSDSTDISNEFVLSGIIVHSGSSIGSGHYIAYMKDYNTQKWYECNDNSIQHITNFDSNSNEIQSNCHVLLYIKK